MSVFLDSENLIIKNFWTLDTRDKFPETFRTTVQHKKKNEDLIEATLILSQDCLVKIGTNSIKKSTLLDWKIVEAFEEDNGELRRFGFSVSTQSCKKDFYVKNEETLEAWIMHLSSVCIMANFKIDFSLIKQIGSGSFGTVYLAASNDTCDMFAVKSIDKHIIIGHQVNLSNLMNEIQFMRKLNHPNIVKLHYVYESTTHIYLFSYWLFRGRWFVWQDHEKKKIQWTNSCKIYRKTIRCCKLLELT
ncbi:unnamed protein product [Blepharisma stoltei]|uniref:non-specific serine/threonine protein kinase n=1 Tax=Blepharisma stoltei TaxID=1481888 RepID=A0AAU9INE9_9CILI|nr:unnamed protein product [Blepharisma stoltei]